MQLSVAAYTAAAVTLCTMQQPKVKESNTISKVLHCLVRFTEQSKQNCPDIHKSVRLYEDVT